MCKTGIQTLSLHTTSVTVMQHANVPYITTSTYRSTVTSHAEYRTPTFNLFYFLFFFFYLTTSNFQDYLVVRQD
jgi:hypothetical protein